MVLGTANLQFENSLVLSSGSECFSTSRYAYRLPYEPARFSILFQHSNSGKRLPTQTCQPKLVSIRMRRASSTFSQTLMGSSRLELQNSGLFGLRAYSCRNGGHRADWRWPHVAKSGHNKPNKDNSQSLIISEKPRVPIRTFVFSAFLEDSMGNALQRCTQSCGLV